ncbi:MAG TPA: hypothetical protein VNH46_04755, partial [Gemmatimonadales bacterium]|nr:hypothetical protein [Gemmatimonadales bacterium]
TAYSVWVARREVTARERGGFEAEAAFRTIRSARRATLLSVLAVLGGMVILVFGGRALVTGSVALARLAGVTERVIGLTVVAVGTSMPELAASLVAALRGRCDVAVANLIGSNIFNLLGILGTTALVAPVPVNPALLNGDMLWMLATSLALFPILRSGMRVTRLEGAALLGSYGVYLWGLLH